MIKIVTKIAFGGGCHWCTEAVFQSVLGVEKVEQGYVASINENHSFSEAVIVHFNSKRVTLKTLIEIHLWTHQSSANHSMRKKYRSAIYVYDDLQMVTVRNLLNGLQEEFNGQLITQVLLFHDFQPSREEITNYYFKNPEKPFCEVYINPKLQLLLDQFSGAVDHDKLIHLKM